jgi:peptidylprolyl isomerase
MASLHIPLLLVVVALLGWAGGAWWTGSLPATLKDLAPPDTTEVTATAATAPTAPATAGPAAPVNPPPAPLDPVPASTPATPADVPPAAAEAAVPAVRLQDIEALLAALPAAERDTWLADTESLTRLLEEEATLRSVLVAAAANKALDDPLTALLVQRARDRMLVDLYLARVVRANLSPDYPSPEDVRKFFDTHPERFLLQERVPVWQIYMALPAGGDEKTAAALEAEARKLAQALAKGETTFAAAAARYSQHQQSRFAGGYMGLLALPEMLPEVRAALERLKEGAVSEPVRTSQGWHIVKRGARVPEQRFEFSEVEAEARQALLREAAAEVKAAAVAKIREQYKVAYPAAEVDGWHQQLLSREWNDRPTPTPASTSGAAPDSPSASP